MGEMKTVLERWKGRKRRKDEWIILILVGILLLIIIWPEHKETTVEESELPNNIHQDELDYKESLETQLADVLQSIDGIDMVKVMITLETSEENVVLKETDVSKEITEETDSIGGNRTIEASKTEETVCYEEQDKPYVTYTKTPKVEGVLVVAGGNQAGLLRNQIVKAVQALFDVESHKVVVIKMKES